MNNESPRISIVVAVDENGIIGKNNGLPWERLPADMARFRRITKGKHIVMGRKTFESIGAALPGRKNIVLTKNLDYKPPECFIAHTVGDVFRFIEPCAKELVVIGGKDVFRQFIPWTDKVYLTIVHGHFDGDVTFPNIRLLGSWVMTYSYHRQKDEKNPWPLTFRVFERKTLS